MIVWRIVSSRIYCGKTITSSNTVETEFYANPEKFCKALSKYFKEFYDENKDDGVILGNYEENELSNFEPDELVINFNCAGTCQLFNMRFKDWDEPAFLVEIETAEVVL
jgi:hypothetical protein